MRAPIPGTDGDSIGCEKPKDQLKTNRPEPPKPSPLLAPLRRKSVASLAREMTEAAPPERTALALVNNAGEMEEQLTLLEDRVLVAAGVVVIPDVSKAQPSGLASPT